MSMNMIMPSPKLLVFSSIYTSSTISSKIIMIKSVLAVILHVI